MEGKKPAINLLAAVKNRRSLSPPWPDYVTWVKFIKRNYSLQLFLSGEEVVQEEEEWVCWQSRTLWRTLLHVKA